MTSTEWRTPHLTQHYLQKNVFFFFFFVVVYTTQVNILSTKFWYAIKLRRA